MSRASKISPYRLGRGIRAFSVQRGCDDCRDPYDGFNVCHYTGDDPRHVAACRRNLSRVVGGIPLIIPRQTHSLNVLTVDTTTPDNPVDVDALVTALPEIALVVNTADCVPLLMADDRAGIIAATHSGWKGTVGRIAELTVERMAALGADRSNIRAAIGPSICTDCFEVGEEVAAKFTAAGMTAVVARGDYEKPHVDLVAAVALTLIESGVKRENILLSGECSRCEPSRWFSARYLSVDSGRTASVITRRG